jgi:amidase
VDHSGFVSATEHATAIRARRISSLELTDLYLGRIERHDPALHAIVVRNDDDARRTALDRDADLKAGIIRGPLHGVPVTVKESFNLAGLKTTVNFPPIKDHIAVADAFVVRRLRAAGACILGKTNIPTMLSDYQSFGPLYPTANNPYDVARTPGGSTGGGAAAVAAGLTALEIGTDIGGSIRVPAHFCGVFGLKPTENIPMHGDGHVPPLPGARGGFIAMASVGPLARTMADIDLAWTVINEPTWKYFLHCPVMPRVKTALNEYRIAWFDDTDAVACGNETRRILGTLLRALESAGVRCEKRPFDGKWLAEAYAIWALLFGTIIGQDSSWIVRQIMKRQFGAMARGSVLGVLGSLKIGLDLRFKEFSRALKRRVELVQDLQRRFDEYDFIVSPVAAGPAFRHNHRHAPIDLEGGMLAYIDYCAPFASIYNACGNPALVVPAGRSREGLPIGIQIAAPHYGEQELIHFGRLIEPLGTAFRKPDGY